MKWYQKKDIQGMRVRIINDIEKIKSVNLSEGVDYDASEIYKAMEGKCALNNSIQIEKDALYKTLEFICDKKTNIQSTQNKRYEQKYFAAKNYKNVLKLEADLKGITVQKLASDIIKKHETYKLKIMDEHVKIDTFRTAMKKLIINTNYEDVLDVLDVLDILTKFNTLDNITASSIKKIIGV